MTGHDILQRALAATHARVPLELVHLELAHVIPGRDAWSDALVKLRYDGQQHNFQVEIKSVVDRVHSLRLLSERAPYSEEHKLLVAPFISPTLAAECERLGLNFIDMAGNARVKVPGLFVFVSGNPRPELQEPTSTYSALRTANGLRIVFALLTQAELVHGSQREIADAADVALGSVGRVLEDLSRLGYLSPGKGAKRRLLAENELQQAWAQQYPVSLRHKLNPRRYAAAAGKTWRDMQWMPGSAAWGAEVAASHLDGYLIAEEASVYSWLPREKFIIENRLRPDTQGTIEVLDAFWSVEGQADAMDAPWLLVYADLINSPDGRNVEAASRLWEAHRNA